MTDNKEPQTGFSIDLSIARDFRQQRDNDVRDSVREYFGASRRTDDFIERIKKYWEEWEQVTYSGQKAADDGVTPRIIKDSWRDFDKTLDAFLKASEGLPLGERLLVSGSFDELLRALPKMQKAVKDYRHRLGGLDTQKNKGKKWDRQSFIRNLVLAYYESFDKLPTASSKGPDQKFQKLAWELTKRAHLGPPSKMERLILQAKKDLKAEFAADKL
jgi:hypothetical protein